MHAGARLVVTVGAASLSSGQAGGGCGRVFQGGSKGDGRPGSAEQARHAQGRGLAARSSLCCWADVLPCFSMLMLVAC